MEMARDEMVAAQRGVTPPVILEACRRIAEYAGLWWPFANSVFYPSGRWKSSAAPKGR